MEIDFDECVASSEIMPFGRKYVKEFVFKKLLMRGF